jgi:hypothetical protein
LARWQQNEPLKLKFARITRRAGVIVEGGILVDYWFENIETYTSRFGKYAKLEIEVHLNTVCYYKGTLG